VARESAIGGLKDTQKQSEEELNMKKVQRLRNVVSITLLSTCIMR
jgi:hypothetical protein